VGNVLIDNSLGVDRSGAVALSNRSNGVSIEGASGTIIAGDLIAANAQSGVQLIGGATANLIVGCTIGTDLAGVTARGNAVGVFLNGVSGNVVGGTRPGQGNLISGNATAGVYLFGRFTSSNRVEGNTIGTDRSGRLGLVGTGGVAVQGAGVLINQAPGRDVTEHDAPGNLIGGSGGAGNLISGNLVGVELVGSDSKGNSIQGNLSGPSSTGGPGAGNVVGVFVNGAPRNVVGSTCRNVISGNATVGVFIFGNLATGNVSPAT
jgi:hypothetical protein